MELRDDIEKRDDREIEGLVDEKTNEKDLKTLSFNDKDKIKGKVNSTSLNAIWWAIPSDGDWHSETR
ncbi:hypothetical protein DVH24_025657 [Malus domestica]|uniref:Uncharacterized protein n=1 Tax=Malus domestica TaxID=3750 RepID=A0A498KH66_MALDO|nr:hypothetical protein DVH24_025657 [Malus domestica]